MLCQECFDVLLVIPARPIHYWKGRGGISWMLLLPYKGKGSDLETLYA